MSENEKHVMLKALTGETDDDVLSAYLYLAGQKICRLAYPYNTSATEVPAQYEHLQIDAAVYLLNKRGAEGEEAHSENGITRSYENADLPASMLREIVPFCGVIS